MVDADYETLALLISELEAMPPGDPWLLTKDDASIARDMLARLEPLGVPAPKLLPLGSGDGFSFIWHGEHQTHHLTFNRAHAVIGVVEKGGETRKRRIDLSAFTAIADIAATITGAPND